MTPHLNLNLQLQPAPCTFCSAPRIMSVARRRCSDFTMSDGRRRIVLPPAIGQRRPPSRRAGNRVRDRRAGNAERVVAAGDGVELKPPTESGLGAWGSRSFLRNASSGAGPTLTRNPKARPLTCRAYLSALIRLTQIVQPQPRSRPAPSPAQRATSKLTPNPKAWPRPLVRQLIRRQRIQFHRLSR